MVGEETVQQANEEIASQEEEPKSLEEFLEVAEERPSAVSQSVQYLLDAIESCGTRNAIERGEEKERWCFFDDPYGDGEHAILGNTDELNDFVDEVRRMATEAGENNKIFWIKGPTATGKSELKRCIVNGLKGYSRTEEGKRYTVEWNIRTSSSRHGMTYNTPDTAADWYRSPVGMNPISVLPESTREEFVERLTERDEELTPIEAGMDPFSREVFEHLKREYSEDGVDNLFEKITDEQHFRVVRRKMEESDGIGILHAEDGGSEKERLVGSWMPEILKEFQSRGRKNAQAFTYDGALSQGFGGVTIVEDARQHIDIIQKLLNIPEENSVKLDRKIQMDVDTVLILVSNPDLAAEIKQYAEEGQEDPFRALRRRMSRYDLCYLTSVSLEANLLHRLLLDSDELWYGDDVWEEVRKPVEVYGCRFEPHSIEVAALYNVLTRIDSGTLGGLTDIEKALTFERGFHEDGAERKDIKSLNIRSDTEGNTGVPVTHTLDSLVNVAQDNEHAMANDVVEAMKQSIDGASVFSKSEAMHHQKYAVDVDDYAVNKYEEDTIDAMLMDVRVTEEEIEEYVDSLIAWEEGDEDEYDPYELKDFEIENFAALDKDYKSGAEPTDEVKEIREKEIINPVSSAYYETAEGGEFNPENTDLEKIDTFDILLNSNEWRDVERHYENVDFEQWESPPSNTETEELKQKTVNNMQDMGYSETGAEKASSIAIRRRAV